MPHPRFSSEEIEQRGEGLYERNIRTQAQDSFDGKIVVIDVETGDYEIADTTLQGADRLLAKRRDAALYSLRIGYDAVYSFGGSTLKRKTEGA